MFITTLEQARKTIPNMPGARGVARQVPLSADDGAPNFSFRVFTIKPGGNTPFHSHPNEHLNYVISGQGFLAGENGEQSICQGSFALVLPGEKHQYKNPSSNREDLVIICAVPKEYE